MNKRFIPWVVCGVLILGVIIIGYKACNLYDELSVQKGKYEAYRTVAKADYGKALAVIADQGKVIAEKDKEIAVQKEAVFKKGEQIAAMNKTLSALEKEYAGLSNDLLKIDNLEKQVAGWKGQFSLAQGVISDQEKIIAAWEVKFNAQVKISDEYRAALDKQVALNDVAQDLIKGLESKARAARFKANLTTVAAVAVGGYALYRTLKK